jgi:hypothetical protein
MADGGWWMTDWQQQKYVSGQMVTFELGSRERERERGNVQVSFFYNTFMRTTKESHEDLLIPPSNIKTSHYAPPLKASTTFQ